MRTREKRSRRSIRILVLEDSPEDFALLGETVARDPRNRFQLMCAKSLDEALRMLDGAEYDLVVVDLNVPDSSGAETFRAIHQRCRGLPIVVLTGAEDEALVLELLQAGAQDYQLKKDLDRQAMVRCFVHAVERNRHQIELEEARRVAVEASEAKSRFLATMSHEIRTPMNAILGMAEVLLDRGLREDQTDHVLVLRRAGEDLLELINGLLDFAKLEAGLLPVDNVEFPLWDLLEGCVELFACPAHRKRLTLALEIDPALPGRVRGDPARLRQILINLLGNATKFTDRGEVVLSARAEPLPSPDGVLLRICVQDSGRGIPRQKLQKIFESFVQGDPSVSRCYGGSGLGLALARKLAEHMGGTLRAESELARGNRFTLEIPTNAAQPSGVRHAHASRLEGRRALVVEPNWTERRILTGQLEEWGFRVWPVAGASEAVSALHSERTHFDVVFLACRMAGCGGLRLVQEESKLHEIASKVVLMLPADRRAGDLQLCREIGFGGWIEKPVKPSALERCVSSLFGLERQDERAAPTPPALAPLRVLLVDDSLDNRSLIQAYLRGSPVEVVSASQGREGLERFCQERFDLVLMDIQMPVMDGYEATAAMRAFEQEQEQARTPILALTAFAFETERRRILDAGCDDVMVKPIRKTELVERLAVFGRQDAAEPIRVDVDPDIADLIPDYLLSRRAELLELRDALARGDFELLRYRGHNLKGTGGAYGFEAISEVGRGLETAARDADIPRARESLDRLADYLERVEVVGDGPEKTQPDD